jgi:hypothetical protein
MQKALFQEVESRYPRVATTTDEARIHTIERFAEANPTTPPRWSLCANCHAKGFGEVSPKELYDAKRGCRIIAGHAG